MKINKIEIETFNIDDKNFVEKLTKALGIEKGEKITLMTPQFKRVDGRIIEYYPRTKREFECLPHLDKEELQKIGCQIWEKTNEWIHWLYPSEWYDCIPSGLEILGIFDDKEKFIKGVTDDDIRFGALPYGFKQNLSK